jgi:hypothetical protein
VIEEEMFGINNMCWISAKATLEASRHAEFLILQTGMTAFGKAFYRKHNDLVPNVYFWEPIAKSVRALCTFLNRFSECIYCICNFLFYFYFSQQLAAKLEALRDEYMRYAVDKCSSVLREYHSAVETITGYIFGFINLLISYLLKLGHLRQFYM